jgi:hypothetical protein
LWQVRKAPYGQDDPSLENRQPHRTYPAPIRHNPYWHPLARGRALGYRKGGKGGTWIAKYRAADGKRAQALLGPADDALDADTSAVLTFSDAQAAAREWFAQLDRNAGRRPEPYTVGQALNDYLENFTGKSLEATRYTIERHLRPEFGSMQVTELTTERLAAFVNRNCQHSVRIPCEQEGGQKEPSDRPRFRAHSGVECEPRVYATPCRSQPGLHDGQGARRHSLATGEAVCKVDSPRIRYFTPDEISRLLDAAPEWFKPLVQAALLTGARWSDCFGCGSGMWICRLGTYYSPKRRVGSRATSILQTRVSSCSASYAPGVRGTN